MTMLGLLNLNCLSLGDVVEVLLQYTIDNVSFQAELLETTIDFLISSESGCVLFYDCKDQYFIEYKNIKLNSYSGLHEAQGEYIIFYYDSTNLEFSFEQILSEAQEYNDLDFVTIKKSAIVLHRKYLHTLSINEDLK